MLVKASTNHAKPHLNNVAHSRTKPLFRRLVHRAALGNTSRACSASGASWLCWAQVPIAGLLLGLVQVNRLPYYWVGTRFTRNVLNLSAPQSGNLCHASRITYSMQCGCYLRGVSLFGRRWRRHYALVARAGPPSGESIWFALRFLVPILDHLSADLALPLIGRVPRSGPSSISLALVLPITVFKDQPGVSSGGGSLLRLVMPNL